MPEQYSKILQIAIEDGIFDCLLDPYDKLGNGDPMSSVPVDLERFAKKIIEQCITIADEYVRDGENVPANAKSKIGIEIRKHFEMGKS